MAGREDGESVFRDSRRDWITDRATRRDDLDGPGRDRSPFEANRDGYNNWGGGGTRDRHDDRRNPFLMKELFDDKHSSRGFNDRNGSDRGRFEDRNRGNSISRERSPGRANPFENDSRRRCSRDRSPDRLEKDTNRWESRDRFGRDIGRNVDHRSPSPVGKNVDNWGRELRLGAASRNEDCGTPDRSSRNDRQRTGERARSQNVSKDGSRRRSRERDWKRSVDDFLGTRGSQGSSPSSHLRSRGRNSPGDRRDRSGWDDKFEEEWDREIRRFEQERVRVPPAPIIRDNRRSPKRGFSPRDHRRSRSRDFPRRSRSRETRRSRSRHLPRRSHSRELLRRSRSRDRPLRRSRSRDAPQRNELRRSREPRELSLALHKSRDLTPVIDEKSDGEDMVISDDDNNEDNKQNANIDDWEQMMLMKYSKNEDEGERKIDFRARPPQKTIVIRCMPSHVTEVDIHLDITSSNLVCHDIRLVRRKDTGFSRGFAFVEFYNVEDATSWMELKQGILRLGKAKCLMEYSVPREAPAPPAPAKYLNDWICNKCQAHNFSKRFLCFVCSATRTFGDVESSDLLVSDHPTHTVVLLGLDVLTSDETVLKSIASLSDLPIRSVKVARDPFTNISKGGCYLEMNSVIDAYNLFNILKTNVPEIDGKRPEVKYARIEFSRPTQAVSMIPKSATATGKAGNAAIAAAQWSNQQGGSVTQEHTLADIPRLAEYSASLYATTPAEKIAYYAYYQGYYKEQISKGIAISLPTDSAAGLAIAQAALAASKDGLSSTSSVSPLAEPPDGSGTTMYPFPDTSVYQYDPSSGFYYDPFTTLYYDGNSQYYYNTKLGKYLYWDAARKTYLPTPSSAETPEMSQANAGSEKNSAVIVGAPQPAPKVEEKKKEKEGDIDRVKVAKRIAKDMEKWAKTLNQKKETAKQANTIVSNPAPEVPSVSISQSRFGSAGAADIGFAVLERKDHLSTLGNYYDAMAAMRGESSSSGVFPPSVESDEEDEMNEDKNHTDWERLICLLCKRQLGSREALIKHQQMSDLHNQNLAAWYRAHGLDPDDAQKRKNQYRDRASERRQKYGMPDTPKPSRLKQRYIKARETAYEQPTVKGIGTENRGNRLLQKMGWQQGMGLGKKNQGRTSIIEATSRSATAGLGTRSVGVTPGPGETYKDCVKKMMAARYAQLDDHC